MMENAVSQLESRLLIVDDDPGTIRLLAHILKDVGRIRFTTRGGEAAEMARSYRPDLILLDVEMPETSGFCVCEEIKRDPAFQDVPILFVTAHGDVDIETRALTAGAIDFIQKPPHPPVVKARVMNYLALKQRADQLRLLSTIDGLTGVANRRAFDTALELEWRRACRAGDPLSLLLLDIDYFKRLNDRYGHQIGDDCLRAVAATVGDMFKRAGELVARFGGEEFVVLLPACSAETALGLADAVHRRIAGLGIPNAGSDVDPCVTVSIGISSMPMVCEAAHGGSRGRGPCPFQMFCSLAPSTLVKAADEALYDVKRQGRNGTRLYSLGQSQNETMTTCAVAGLGLVARR